MLRDTIKEVAAVLSDIIDDLSADIPGYSDLTSEVQAELIANLEEAEVYLETALKLL